MYMYIYIYIYVHVYRCTGTYSAAARGGTPPCARHHWAARAVSGTHVVGVSSERPPHRESPVVDATRKSRCRRGRGEPSPGADVAGASPVPAQTWQG